MLVEETTILWDLMWFASFLAYYCVLCVYVCGVVACDDVVDVIADS